MEDQEQNKENVIKRSENVDFFKIFFTVLNNYFRSLNSWMTKVPDFRDPEKCIYPIQYMIFMGLLIFLLRLKSLRNQHQLNGQILINNLNQYLDVNIQTINHFSTLIYFCKGINPQDLEKLQYKMMQKLIRKKIFTKYRLLNEYYLIALDGTNNVTFKKPHCPKCIRRKASNGEIYYYHPVLEAKLVTGSGLAFSIGTEFVENEIKTEAILSDKEKQDCELKAAYRLIERLHKQYPQLKICLLADSLYANQQIMQKCKEFGWKYIITFKEGSIPNLYKEFESLIQLEQQNKKVVKNDEVEQEIRWMNHINHEDHLVHIVECQEYKIRKKTKKRFVFITNIVITKENVEEILWGGRLRWKIENEGFNIQKNKGYNLGHHFSRHETAIKTFYILMQIAHMINQLVEKSNLLKPYKGHYFTSLQELSKRLMYELIKQEIDFNIIKRNRNYIVLSTG